ncbi:hypothetical protein Kfla_5086 [Kribbella flavida DSM 17836]|uniref:Uncharacterized protein n=1 Tax=Kribbella flavida (strain DSM 17836 / JCM 10339 / NBRC 14399) TaxID=479435 RepID=D2Q3H9_KRIFD|nr:hypothetical protein [Kribbella flavida]ADB34102.1 hypothetical protein Kfla_5086 [Kribbella flavida DSM 17836]
MVQHYRDDTDTRHHRFTADHTATEPVVEEGPGHDHRPAHRADVDTAVTGEVHPAYRGFKGGSAFFGWLIAVGLTVLLTAIVSAIAAAVDYAVTIDRGLIDEQAGTIGIVSGALLVLVLAIAYYNGGYVAGRLARFDGARQGFGVWGIGVAVTLIVAGIGALAGSQYDVLDRVDLPSIPIAGEDLTTGGLILAAAVLVVTLLAAVIGGKAGQRYHHRIDNSFD